MNCDEAEVSRNDIANLIRLFSDHGTTDVTFLK